MLRPAVVLRRRAKCRSWAETHRAVTARNPWLFGQLPFGPYLPGGGCDLTIGSQLIEPQHTRLVHGLLTHLVGEEHVPGEPAWSLLPWPTGCGWAVYWWDEEHLARFAGRRFRVRFGTSTTEARFGPAARLRSPGPLQRGHQRVRLDSLTPVVIRRDGGTHTYTAPTAETLVSSLAISLRPRLGLGRETEDLRLELVERHTEPGVVWCGEKLGRVHGWQGYVILDANAPARWLLEVAARGPGLGGRTAYGFGRIRISTA